jgi:aryl-alcohol dehydrogenase-like predicted oxidoreductase
MQPRQLGVSDLFVPPLAFGTGTFGGGPDWPYGNTDVTLARRLVDRCIDVGMNLFDSADVYGSGRAQEILGEVIRGRRDRVLLSVKAGLPIGAGPADGGAGRLHLVSSVDGALARLGTDYLDLFQLHAFDARVPVEETLGTLGELVHAGKIRYLGVSNFPAWQVMKSLAASERGGYPRYVAQQVYYSLVGRDFEIELMAMGQDQGVGALVWSPLAGGWLAGSVRRDQPPQAGGRLARLGDAGPAVDRELLYRVMDALDQIAAEIDKTVAQIAINWLLRRPTIASVIVGADDEAQLEQNLGAVSWALTPEHVAKLDAASSTPVGYPHFFYHRDEPFAVLSPPIIRRAV